MLNTVRVCIETAPTSKPELLEEQESWLRDWNVAMSDMTAVYERARAASLHVSLNDMDAVTLAEGKIAARTLTRAVKSWKEKAEESAVTMRPAHADKGKGKEVIAAEEKAVEKVAGSGPTDMGQPHLGGWMTVSSVTHPAERCERCAVSGAKCVVVHAGGRCEGCIKAQKGCSFVAAKNKGRVPAAPKCKAPPSVQTTAPDTAAPAKEIIVQRPKRALAPDAAPAAKCPRLEADLELEEARAEAARLRAQNAELRAQNDKYCTALTDIRQHSCTQESELMHMSNQLYAFARDWGTWEKKLGEILEE
ncbi:uncharacterized protein F5147DRAFT_820265 [Suillus discolor]|uniref:Uncharacterized protein n=1 Tax=Suillus discolor TaxID=1912936 RepID=A0A9P7FEZ1_9AGAM|nr:uncharacterized protein F5147DRAFT_820265 [Suillus discolor]KAG2115164.1 hypothetical protein F5147DRAFT_820265 [Suillus discolor]